MHASPDSSAPRAENSPDLELLPSRDAQARARSRSCGRVRTGTAALLLSLLSMTAAACGEEGRDRSAVAGSERAGGDAHSTPAGRAARHACAGKSARAVRKTFAATASRRANPRERAFLNTAEPSKAEPRSAASAAIAARTYAMTLPESERRDGYAVCAAELSKRAHKEPNR